MAVSLNSADKASWEADALERTVGPRAEVSRALCSDIGSSSADGLAGSQVQCDTSEAIRLGNAAQGGMKRDRWPRPIAHIGVRTSRCILAQKEARR